MGVLGENRFLLETNNVFMAALALPASFGNFGLNIRYAGFGSFSEYQAGLAYARRIGSVVDIGSQFNYYAYRIAGYAASSTINFELGLLLHLSNNLNLGIHGYNPAGSRFSTGDEKLESVFTMGLGYDASEAFFAGLELVKQEARPLSLNAAIHYRFQKQFFLSLGLFSSTATVSAAVGLSWKHLRVDLGGSFHPVLGMSPAVLFLMDQRDVLTQANYKPAS
jgi:hypothetical protein